MRETYGGYFLQDPWVKHFFKCLGEFPEDHITQISLFICLGTPSKGSLRFVSLVLPFLS